MQWHSYIHSASQKRGEKKKSLKKYNTFEEPKKKREKKSRSGLFLYAIWYSKYNPPYEHNSRKDSNNNLERPR
jgi:hypothetical protein